MSFDQIAVVATLVGALGLFAWGYWRYDLVALIAVLVLVELAIIPEASAFSGFGHPAVITVAALLVISVSLEKTGIADLRKSARPLV